MLHAMKSPSRVRALHFTVFCCFLLAILDSLPWSKILACDSCSSAYATRLIKQSLYSYENGLKVEAVNNQESITIPRILQHAIKLLCRRICRCSHIQRSASFPLDCPGKIDPATETQWFSQSSTSYCGNTLNGFGSGRKLVILLLLFHKRALRH